MHYSALARRCEAIRKIKRSELVAIARDGDQTRHDEAVRTGERIGRTGTMSVGDLRTINRLGHAFPLMMKTALEEHARRTYPKSTFQVDLENRFRAFCRELLSCLWAIQAAVWLVLVVTFAFDLLGWLR